MIKRILFVSVTLITSSVRALLPCAIGCVALVQTDMGMNYFSNQFGCQLGMQKGQVIRKKLKRSQPTLFSATSTEVERLAKVSTTEQNLSDDPSTSILSPAKVASPLSSKEMASASAKALVSSAISTSNTFNKTESFLESNNFPDGVVASADYQRGLLTIAFITVLFSSNSPVLHAAFVAAENPPPVLLLNAATSVIALGGLTFGGPLLDATVPLPCTLEEDAKSRCEDTLDGTSIRAGLELGTWKMLGTTANLYGLSLTSADHGAFLIQLTTLIVPAVQGILGVPIPTRIRTAIALALSGVFIFTQDTAVGADTLSASSLRGDAFCVLAAIFYATYDLRLFEWGKKVAPLRLITNKIAIQAALSIALMVMVCSGEVMEYVNNLVSACTTGGGLSNDAVLLGLVALWSGVAINAVAPFLQVGAQQAVGASRAQVVYASQPLWASLMSFVLLGETVGIEGIVGGGLFMAAMFLAATAESPDPNCGEDMCEV